MNLAGCMWTWTSLPLRRFERNRGTSGNGRRREGGEGVKIQRKAENKAVLEENKVRSSKAECGEEAKNEREVCQESILFWICFSRACQMNVHRWLPCSKLEFVYTCMQRVNPLINKINIFD